MIYKFLFISIILFSCNVYPNHISFEYERSYEFELCNSKSIEYINDSLIKMNFDFNMDYCYFKEHNGYIYGFRELDNNFIPKMFLDGYKGVYGRVEGLKPVYLTYLCNNDNCSSWFLGNKVEKTSFSIYIEEEPVSYYTDEEYNAILVEIEYNETFEMFTVSDVDNDNLIEVNFLRVYTKYVDSYDHSNKYRLFANITVFEDPINITIDCDMCNNLTEEEFSLLEYRCSSCYNKIEEHNTSKDSNIKDSNNNKDSIIINFFNIFTSFCCIILVTSIIYTCYKSKSHKM